MTHNIATFLYLFVFFHYSATAGAAVDKLRCMWRSNPATTMTIGWNQISGQYPVLHYGEQDFQLDVEAYPFSQTPDRVVAAKGMKNHFARLIHLKPNTVYYFVIADSDGCSQRFSFQTAPDHPEERLSIIAGGDSRNHRTARRNANKLVAKLQPHCVFFGGDMTGGDTAREWLAWFDDWQHTIRHDGRMVPIVVARGNHEYSNATLYELFDTPNKDMYYALSLGGNLLRLYTLNSLMASGGDQRTWLKNDLRASSDHLWRFAQYHYAIRPHTRSKKERNTQLENWATLFYKFKVKLVMESDAHVVKMTYPVRPSRERGSEEGFIRDDANGTTYIGEGCWGAPLRRNNDDKNWTRASGSFNQFKLIFVDRAGVEIRTVKTDNADAVLQGDPYDRFYLPEGLEVWHPNGESVLYIGREQAVYAQHTALASDDVTTLLESIVDWDDGRAFVTWRTTNEASADATFEVQRSINGDQFKTFALVSGRQTARNDYRIEDCRISNTGDQITYRLKHTDHQGATCFYPVVNLAPWEDYQTVVVNPETGLVKISYSLEKPGDVAISLFNRSEMELKKRLFKNQKMGNYLKSIDLSTFPRGSYLLVIKRNDKVINHFRIDKEV